jgi:hypothetical protein
MSNESRNSCNLAQNFINNKGTKSREEVEVPKSKLNLLQSHDLYVLKTKDYRSLGSDSTLTK